MTHLKLKNLLRERFNFQDVVDDVVEIAAKYSKSKEIWDERDVEHRNIDELIKSIKNTGFIPSSKWSSFMREVQKNMPRYTPNFKKENIKEEKIYASDFKKSLQYATETSPDKIKVMNFDQKSAKVKLPHAFYKDKLEKYLNGVWKEKIFKVTDVKRAAGIGSIYTIEIKDK